MTVNESPAGARRRLRLALRRARESKHLTQGQLATALDWSLSKIQRIELGDTRVSATDLEAIMSRLDISDVETVAEYKLLAKASRRRGWWDDPRYKDHLPPGLSKLLQFESEAKVIRAFNPTLIPGLLQTQEYAKYLFDYWQDELSETEREIRLEVRMKRRDQVLGRPNPPEYLVVLDESVMHRASGRREHDWPRMMANQLQEILVFIRKGQVSLRILPLLESASIAMLNTFLLLDLGEEEDDSLLYREAELEDDLEQQPERVQLYRVRFDRIWANALNEEASVRRIELQVASLLASLD